MVYVTHSWKNKAGFVIPEWANLIQHMRIEQFCFIDNIQIYLIGSDGSQRDK